MAIVGSNTYQDEDDENSPNTGGSPVKSGVVSLSTVPDEEGGVGTAPGNVNNVSPDASGTSVNTATPGTPSGNDNANASGSWTNLNDYLNANTANSATNNLGGRVLNTVNTAATQGTGIINSAGQNFQGDVTTGTDTYNPKLSQDALAAPTSFLQGPEYTQLVSELTGDYNGPSDWGTSTEAANATQGETNAEQTANLGLTSQGRQQILNQTAATPYTQGQSSLNEFLLDNNQSQLQPITQAANVGGNLQGQYQTVAQNAGNEVTAGQNTSAATGQQAKGDILGGQTALVNQLTTQAQQAATAANTTSQGVSSDLSKNTASLTPTELSYLGITQDQYNQLIALNQQAIAAGAPGITFSSYYAAPNTAGITPASEATTGQISDFNALNTLVPGSNQQFLSGATGNPLSVNGTFNIGNAMTDLQAQIQAAQSNAAQISAAGAATGTNGGSTLPAAATAGIGIGAIGTLINLGGKIYQWINGPNGAPTLVPTSDNADDPSQDEVNNNPPGPEQPTAGLSDPTYTDPASIAPAAASTVLSAPASGSLVPTITVSDPTILPASSADFDTSLTAAGGTDAAAGTADLGADLTPAAETTADTTIDNLFSSLDDVPPVELPAAASSAFANATTTLGVVGAVYGLYNFVNNYQSGATAQDAMNGIGPGASIGGLAGGPVGAVIGAVIGAAVGAISSAFGGGKPDQETEQLYNYDSQYAQNPTIANSNTPAQNYQILAGVFDGKSATPGHSTAIEQIFGRMGEGNFVSQMTAKINQAVSSGQIPPNASASQIYSQVVDPWLASYTGQYGAGQTTGQILPSDQDAQGNNLGNALVGSIESLIGQWQTGQFSNNMIVGAQGQTINNLPAYAGASSFAPYVPPVLGSGQAINGNTIPTAQATTNTAVNQLQTDATNTAPNAQTVAQDEAAAQQAYLQQLASQGYYANG